MLQAKVFNSSDNFMVKQTYGDLKVIQYQNIPKFEAHNK